MAQGRSGDQRAFKRSRRGGLPRALILLGVLAGLVWVGWQIIANTAADTTAGIDPANALSWRPDSGPALASLAEQQLSATTTNDSDLAAAAVLAGRALVASPLNLDALNVLGLVADIQGDTIKADNLMRLAGTRSLRDAGAEMWLLDQGIRNADFAGAIANADAILRTQPELADDVYPALLQLAGTDDGLAAMLTELGRNPPWRGWFLQRLPQTPDGVPVAYALLNGLAATPAPPRSSELDPYFEKLIANGNFQQAFLTWLQFLPTDQARSVPFVYNGDFEQPVSGLPFDWQISPIRGADTQVVDTGQSGIGKALRVDFSNTRTPYQQLKKLLLLPPGSYELDGMAKGEGLITPRGMQWVLTCAGASAPLAASDDFLGTFAWRPFTVTFTIPATGCVAQTLRLQLDARSALDQQAAGSFWSDNLAIKRSDIPSAAG